MKIIATSDWHLGNMFHGNDRMPEHRHFLAWLLSQIKELQPDALLIAGDVFDNGNPSALSQSAYYEFLADAAQACDTMRIIITAGNHDSAGRLEAPRALLTRHHVDVRGYVGRTWSQEGESGVWVNNYDDLMIHLRGKEGDEAVVLAVPFLRNDVVLNASYSQGVNTFIRQLTERARAKYPDTPLVMMAHMYVTGSEIASSDASEKIIIGGQEEVNIDGWSDHPDYMTCGHIHKRQHIRNTDWARYSGSVLPMSFAEKDYEHGVDLVTIGDDRRPAVQFLKYQPQHRLVVLPDGDEELTPKELAKLVGQNLPDRVGERLDDDFVYVMLKLKIDRIDNDEIKRLEDIVAQKNAVLCKIQKIIPTIDMSTISGSQHIQSIDDILNRNPLDTLREAFALKHNREMSPEQEAMVERMLNKQINVVEEN